MLKTLRLFAPLSTSTELSACAGGGICCDGGEVPCATPVEMGTKHSSKRVSDERVDVLFFPEAAVCSR